MADFTVRPRRAASARNSGFEWLARAGFVARGAVYLVIGILAVDYNLAAGLIAFGVYSLADSRYRRI